MTNLRRPITQREQMLLDLYSYCQLGMTPQQFYAKWDVTHAQMALVCSRSQTTVQCWFSRGRSHRRPSAIDLRNLALMDFLLEYFEEIPEPLWNTLCPGELNRR